MPAGFHLRSAPVLLTGQPCYYHSLEFPVYVDHHLFNAKRTSLQVYNIKFICSLITIRSGTSNREPVCKLEMQTPQPAHAGTIFPITYWQSTVLNMAAWSVYNYTYMHLHGDGISYPGPSY